jgi:hypothetical protein
MFSLPPARFCSTQTLAKQLTKGFFEGKIKQGHASHCYILDSLYVDLLGEQIAMQKKFIYFSFADRHAFSSVSEPFHEMTTTLFLDKQKHFEAKIGTTLKWRRVDAVVWTKDQKGNTVKIAYHDGNARFFTM